MMLRRILSFLFGDVAACEIVDGEIAIAELRRERDMAIAAAKRRDLPTFDDVWACVSCGVIQAEPVNFRCLVCERSELIDLRPKFGNVVQARPRRQSVLDFRRPAS